MRHLPAAMFFLFICWIIFEANTDEYNRFIEWSRQIPRGDKIGHFFIYGVLAFLLNFSLKFRKIKPGMLFVYAGSVVVSIFAIGEEFTQLAFESRNFDTRDLVADAAGIAIFSALSYLVEINFYKKLGFGAKH